MAGNNGNGEAQIVVHSHEDLNKLYQKEMQLRTNNRLARVRMINELLGNNNITGNDTLIGGMGRAEMFRSFLDGGVRDIDGECGYPTWLTPDHYRAMYDREGIAKRVVDCEPEETWAIDPEVYEDEDDSNETDFEAAWDDLLQAKNLWHYLQRIDTLSGIGQFGILLFGLNDGAPLDQPVEGVEDYEPGSGQFNEERKLLYLRTFSEEVVFVKTCDNDPASPRYGLPVMYSVQFRDYPNWGTGASPIISRDVHWTRVLHVADNLKLSEIYGTPRQQQVYNRLHDLRKVYGASGEGYWKGGFPGMAFEVNPDLAEQDPQIDKEGIRKEMEAYSNGLQRYLAITGVTAKTLPPSLSDPTASVEVQLKAIAISKGIPYRILFGSEEAKLAGSQDSRAWNKRLAKRQTKYVTPKIIRPTVDRLLAYGLLPEPEEYKVDWPDLNAPTDKDKADVALVKTQALAAYVGGNVSALMPPDPFFTQVMGMTTEEKDAVLDAEPVDPVDVGGTDPMAEAEAKAEALKSRGFGQEPSNNSNPNHDPKNGEFARAGTTADHLLMLTSEQRASVGAWLKDSSAIQRADLGKGTKEDAGHLKNIKELMQTAPLEHGTLYRGVNGNMNHKVGDVISFPRITTSTTEKEWAKSFGRGEQGTGGGDSYDYSLYEITKHSGFPVLPHPEEHNHLGVTPVDESLITKDRKFKVVKVLKRKDEEYNQTHYQLEEIKEPIKKRSITRNFDPYHDDLGRFTSEGGGGAAGTAASLIKTSKGLTPLGPGDLAGSVADHTDATGSFTNARKKFHQKVEKHVFGDIPKGDTKAPTPVEVPTVKMLGGGPASGKSTLVNSGAIDVKNHVGINSDEIKELMPEYKALVAEKDYQAASYVHEESSYLAKEFMKKGLTGKYNVMLDGTGDSGIDNFMGKVASWKKAGAKRIVGEYVTVPTKVALDRAIERGNKTGRVVDPYVIAATHQQVSKILPEAIKRGAFDEVRLWDTNGKGPKVAPKLVMEHKDGVTTIHDQKLWKDFLAKGDEDPKLYIKK